MDSTTNSGMNSTHVQQDANGSQYNFLNGVESYGGSSNLQSNNNEYAEFFDPALFDNSTLGHGFSQQPSPAQSAFTSNAARQSHSPALPQYHSTQPSYQPQYQPPFYDSRSLTQSPYDPRYYSRPSPSPVPLDPSYSYQTHLGYAQNYGQQQLSMSMPQQNPTPLQPNYQPRQQSLASYMGSATGQAQLHQAQVL